MPNKNNFFTKVYQLVQQIPPGSVTTYGHIAAALNTRDARKVGWALHANKDSHTPCHRVVTKAGKVSDNFAFGDYKEHKNRLLSEGVTFISEKNVDLSKHLWQSNMLI